MIIIINKIVAWLCFLVCLLATLLEANTMAITTTTTITINQYENEIKYSKITTTATVIEK